MNRYSQTPRHQQQPRPQLLLVCVMFLVAWCLPMAAYADLAVDALPTGGQVVAGQATINQTGTTMAINQTSQRAAIDWNTFNVGANAQVNFGSM